jgi:hypothetical protein
MGHITQHQISAIRAQPRQSGRGTFGNGKTRSARHGNARGLAEFGFQ